MDGIALSAILQAMGGEIRRLEADWNARNEFFAGATLQIPLPIRPSDLDPDNDHRKWLEGRLVDVSEVVEGATNGRAIQ